MTIALQKAMLRLRFGGAVVLCFIGAIAAAAPYIPSSPNEALLTLSDADRRATIVDAKTDGASAISLARSYIALGREQSDERYFGYASAALRPLASNEHAPIEAFPVEALALLADIAQHQHRFDDALEILNALLARDSNHMQARLMRASILMAQGRPGEARIDCRKLFALRELFAATVCSAQAASLNGKLTTSYRTIDELLKNTGAAGNDPAGRLGGQLRRKPGGQLIWARGVVAEMAERQGRLDSAEEHLRAALALSPADLVLRLQLCDVLLSRQRPQQARALLLDAPPTEPVLLRHALIAKQIGNEREQQATRAAWQLAVAQSEQLGIRLHLRELARGQFELLNRPQQAVVTAMQNWQVQREPEDARLLARIGKASNNQAALQQVRQWQRDLQLEDVGLSL